MGSLGCAEVAQKRVLRIPERFCGAVPSQIKNAGLRSVVLRYFSRWTETVAQGWGLALWGPNGCGKSWATAAMLNHATAVWPVPRPRVGDGGLFVRADEFFRRANPLAVLDGGNEAWVDESQDRTWRDRYMKCAFLVLSDLGKEDRRGKMADTAPLVLGTVLRARVQAKLPTCIDTNLSFRSEGPASVKGVYGTSVFDLLQECVVPVKVIGRSLREVAQAKARKIIGGAG